MNKYYHSFQVSISIFEFKASVSLTHKINYFPILNKSSVLWSLETICNCIRIQDICFLKTKLNLFVLLLLFQNIEAKIEREKMSGNQTFK